jgi:Flp pilus assembly protein TadD
MLRWVIGLVGTVAVAMPTVSQAQPSSPYLAALRAYAAGSFEQAIVAVNTLSDRTIIDGVHTLKHEMTSEEVRTHQFNGREARRQLEIALVLHTDAASRARLAFTLPEVATGRADRFFASHESIARRIVRILEAEATTDRDLIRAWYRFTLARLQTYYVLRDAERLGAAAPKWVLDDPEVLLARAAVHEMAWRRRNEDDDDLGLDGNLDHAERWLRAAVVAAPGLVEARVRLGRVQTMRGDLKDALTTLRGVSRDTEAGFAYLAKLFEGDVLDKLGDRQGARAAYQAAIAIMPAARSGPTALAHLLHAAGDRRQAAQVVTALIAEPESAAVEEPWLVYSVGTAWRALDYLEVLRSAVVTK